MTDVPNGDALDVGLSCAIGCKRRAEPGAEDHFSSLEVKASDLELADQIGRLWWPERALKPMAGSGLGQAVGPRISAVQNLSSEVRCP